MRSPTLKSSWVMASGAWMKTRPSPDPSSTMSVRLPDVPVSIEAIVTEIRAIRPSVPSPSSATDRLRGCGCELISRTCTADATGRTSRLPYGAARMPSASSNLPGTTPCNAGSGSRTKIPAEASWMAMVASPRIQPGPTVTTPRTRTIVPSGIARADAMEIGLADGDGLAEGDGLGVGLGLEVGVAVGVGDGVGLGVRWSGSSCVRRRRRRGRGWCRGRCREAVGVGDGVGTGVGGGAIKQRRRSTSAAARSRRPRKLGRAG